MIRRLLFALIVMALGVAAPSRAQAPSFEAAVRALEGGSFAEKIAAVEAIGATGDPRAAALLSALEDGQLYTDEAGRIVVGVPQGRREVRAYDAFSGEDYGVVRTRDLDKIRVNNRLRSVIRGARGSLQLRADDPAARLAAVANLVANPQDGAYDALQAALADERDPQVQAAMATALARLGLRSEERGTRLAAIADLQASLDPDVRADIGAMLGDEEDAELRAAAEEALAEIDRRLTLISYAGYLYQGISLGSVLLLAAIGLAITFGVMGVINLAHGELIMLGAYATFVTQELFRAYLPLAAQPYYLVAALPVAFIVTGLIGMVIERVVIRHLYGRPLETLLATFGVSLILQQLVRLYFGAPNKEVANPFWMSGGLELAGGLTLTYNRLVIIVFCLVVLALVALILRRTQFGLDMRAVTQNRTMAKAMGINTARVDMLTFGLGAGVAGIAGVALSQIGNVSPNLGTIYIVDSFLVVVFGGVGNLAGTFVGAMSLGVINKLLEPMAGAVLGKVAVLVLIILFIQVRPRGLFALKGRAAEG